MTVRLIFFCFIIFSSFATAQGAENIPVDSEITSALKPPNYPDKVDGKVVPAWVDAKSHLQALDKEDCSGVWDLLWPWAKKGNLEARVLLFNAMINDGVTPPGRVDYDFKKYTHDALAMALYSYGYDGTAADDFYRKAEVMWSVYGKWPDLTPFRLCVVEAKSSTCVAHAVSAGFIPSFDEYAKEIDQAAQTHQSLCRMKQSLPAGVAEDDRNWDKVKLDFYFLRTEPSPCAEIWNSLWPWAKDGRLEARVILFYTMLSYKDLELIPPGRRSFNFEQHTKDAVTMALHARSGITADSLYTAFMPYIDSRNAEKWKRLTRCHLIENRESCLNFALENHLIPTFEAYAKEMEGDDKTRQAWCNGAANTGSPATR